MDFRTIFGVLGNLTALMALILLPARSSIRTHAALISCTLWVLYGNGFLQTINAVGFFMELISLTLFISPTFTDQMKHGVIVIVELICVYLIRLLAVNFDDPTKFVGTVCAAGSILISVEEMVQETINYETRRVSLASICGSAASFANGIIWAIYALVSSDIFILIPNVVHLLQYLIRYRAAQAAQAERQFREEIACISRIYRSKP